MVAFFCAVISLYMFISLLFYLATFLRSAENWGFAWLFFKWLVAWGVPVDHFVWCSHCCLRLIT